jgi:hypothetical protein
VIPTAPLGKLAIRHSRLSPVIWLTVVTLAFVPAGYFFKDKWLVYLLVGLPVVAFFITLLIAWWWAIFKPHLLLSEDAQLLQQALNLAITKEGITPAGEAVPPTPSKETPPNAEPRVKNDAANQN